MKKSLLTLSIVLASTSAYAFSWSDLNPFSSDEQKPAPEVQVEEVETVVEENSPPITMPTLPTAEELKVKAAANSITNYFKDNDLMNITDEQKQMLKTSYDYLKSQEITNPELKQIADNAISLIDKSGVFNNTPANFVDSMIR